MRKWRKIGMIVGIMGSFALVPLAKTEGAGGGFMWLEGQLLWGDDGKYYCRCPHKAATCYCYIPIYPKDPQSHPAYLYEDHEYYYFRASIDETVTPPVYTLDENGDGKMAIAKDAFEQGG